jgi:hypothetical protein
VKIFDPTGTRTPAPLVVQHVASRYTDWAIPAKRDKFKLGVILIATKSPASKDVKHGSWGSYGVGSRYQATDVENIADYVL